MRELSVPQAPEPIAEPELESALEPEAAPEPVAAVPEAEPLPDLPAWLAGMETPSAEAEAPVWSLTDASPQPLQQIDPNLASLVELERLPGVGFILAQALIASRERHGPFTALSDLLRVPGVSEDTLTRVQAYLRFPASTPAPVVSTPPAPQPAPPEPQDTPDLALAEQLLTSGDVENALAEYNRLIKERRELPTILAALEAEAPRHPEDVAFLQTLGDVYLRLDRLEDALNTYNRAEDLLR
jgi:competence ComEA-like helix-hairpin-helix protein